MNWENIVQKAGSYIVKIETPSGSGTGFLCGYNEDKTVCCIATALHVVRQADEWLQPIKIYNNDFGRHTFLKETERVIFTDYKSDSAVILFQKGDLDFPEILIPLRPMNLPIGIGVDVGWLGYPGIDPYTLCFFSGSVSARRESGYLIDGVAINGVSGGPVLYSSETDGIEFVGVVSAYHANRLTGDTLPGLLVAQDVSHFHGVVQQIRSMDEAKKKKALDVTQSASSMPNQSPVEANG